MGSQSKSFPDNKHVTDLAGDQRDSPNQNHDIGCHKQRRAESSIRK